MVRWADSARDPSAPPRRKTTTSEDVARMSIEPVYRHRGPPSTIVSDHEPQFVSTFWDGFCRILGVKVKLSTAYHAQTDGQTKIVNQHIVNRLKPFINCYQDNWSDLLLMIDFAPATLHLKQLRHRHSLLIIDMSPGPHLIGR